MKINEFFAEHNKIALAFSGGADSSYLLYAAVKCGADVAPYFEKSQFQPEFEREDAYRLARELGVRLHEIDVDVLQFHDVTVNPSKVLAEEHILSPLRTCGISKSDVRRLSHEAGLFTWDKPAYACLATRVPAGEEITGEKLHAVEQSEAYLFSLGYTDFRVRLRDGGALLQLTAKQHERAENEFELIKSELKKYFDIIGIDPNVREESK